MPWIKLVYAFIVSAAVLSATQPALGQALTSYQVTVPHQAYADFCGFTQNADFQIWDNFRTGLSHSLFDADAKALCEKLDASLFVRCLSAIKGQVFYVVHWVPWQRFPNGKIKHEYGDYGNSLTDDAHEKPYSIVNICNRMRGEGAVRCLEKVRGRAFDFWAVGICQKFVNDSQVLECLTGSDEPKIDGIADRCYHDATGGNTAATCEKLLPDFEKTMACLQVTQVPGLPTGLVTTDTLLENDFGRDLGFTRCHACKKRKANDAVAQGYCWEATALGKLTQSNGPFPTKEACEASLKSFKVSGAIFR